jgi:hypothetical protein
MKTQDERNEKIVKCEGNIARVEKLYEEVGVGMNPKQKQNVEDTIEYNKGWLCVLTESEGPMEASRRFIDGLKDASAWLGPTQVGLPPENTEDEKEVKNEDQIVTDQDNVDTKTDLGVEDKEDNPNQKLDDKIEEVSGVNEEIQTPHQDELDLTKMNVTSLRSLAKEKKIAGYSKMNKETLIEELSKPLHNVEEIAKACHEANKAYCESIGDTSQPSWEDAPEWQRNSAIDGVKNVIDGVVTSPEQSHESWMKEKVDNGWKFGEVKNPETKEHPCIVPYEELPEEQKKKDDIFFGIVNEMTGKSK